VFFSGEIIEERSLADIGGVRDVFDGSFQIATLGKDPQGGTIDAFASFYATALAPIGGPEA
jgi:hypothetical protein